LNQDWSPIDTNSHQDHVIAHVIGATVLGHFTLDETAFLFLDIGFIWNVYLDGEMGLLPHPVALAELQTDDVTKAQLRADVDKLQSGSSEEVSRMTYSDMVSAIESVAFFGHENSRRLTITCETGSIVVETSLEGAEVNIYERRKI